jgi:hypothetical protein
MARKPATKPAAPRRTRYQVADTLGEASAVALVQQALAGNKPLPASLKGAARTLLWDDHGDQALVHVDSVVVRFVKRFAFVSVELETEQTGRAALIVTLAFGSTQDGAGLYAATDQLPRGHPLLAARWGELLQQTVWSAFVDLARQHAGERGKVPFTMHVLDGHLRFAAETAIALKETAIQTFDQAFPGRLAAFAAKRGTK